MSAVFPKLAERFGSTRSRFLLGLAVVVLICPAGWLLFWPSDEDRAIAAVEDLVRSGAFDPDAMRFRNMAVRVTPTGAHVVCGEANGKNRLGGYTGYQPFVYKDGEIQSIDLETYEFWCYGKRHQ